MQNKAKVKYAKINISTYLTMRYENIDIWLFRQTKPKQTQLNPILSQFNPIKANSNPKQSQLERSASLEPVEGNKPNVETALRAKPLQAQSAKMAQKLTSSINQNNTLEKYNFIYANMLNSLSRHNLPTGTSFAYLSLTR